MYIVIKDTLWKLIGGRTSSIPSRFLRILLIAICIHMSIHVTIGIFTQQIGSLYVTIPGLLLFSSSYIFLYITGRENPIKVLMFVIACILLSLSWFVNAGAIGATPVFFVLSTFSFVAFTPSRLHLPLIAALMLVYCGLYGLEGLHPDWVKSYITAKSHSNDVFFSTFFIAIAICTVFSLMMQQLESQNKVLAEKVKEQAQLSNQLEIQYNRQIELNQALDSFVYRSSHDLRAPISSALGLIDITKQAESREEINRYLDLQQKSLKKLDTFINDILYYSQNRHKEIILETISIDSLIQESLTQIQHLPSYNRIEFTQNLAGAEEIIGDRLRMRIIFNNIISNAYKYYDIQKPTSFLKINTKKDDKKMYITFEDNGLGIKSELIPKIFDMFYRATHKAEGTGIGLFIVKEAIQKMGGSISCTSTLKEGCKFEIILPLLKLGNE